jgi:hypothetical protein
MAGAVPLPGLVATPQGPWGAPPHSALIAVTVLRCLSEYAFSRTRFSIHFHSGWFPPSDRDVPCPAPGDRIRLAIRLLRGAETPEHLERPRPAARRRNANGPGPGDDAVDATPGD